MQRFINVVLVAIANDFGKCCWDDSFKCIRVSMYVYRLDSNEWQFFLISFLAVIIS